MIDQKRAAEALRQIQELQRKITTHQANVSRIEREKADKVRYFDQQIRNEQDQIKRSAQQIEQLKREI